MKIISNKKYEKLQQTLVDLQLDLNEAYEDNKTYNMQVEHLLEEKRILLADNQKMECDILDYKKEIKKLKTLLTKNKIEYKKEK